MRLANTFSKHLERIASLHTILYILLALPKSHAKPPCPIGFSGKNCSDGNRKKLLYEIFFKKIDCLNLFKNAEPLTSGQMSVLSAE